MQIQKSIKCNDTPSCNAFDFSKVKIKKILKQEDDFSNALCVLKDGRLASCSNKRNIKVYSLVTYQCELKFKCHKDSVTYICQSEAGYLVSSSYDRQIKIWNINKDNYERIAKLKGHNSWVFKVIQLSNERLGSCSDDKTIRIWNSNSPYQCLKIIQGHTDGVISIIELKNKKYIVSCGRDCTVIFWNSLTYENEKVIKDIYCCDKNSIVEIENNKLIIGGEDSISIINLSTLKLETKTSNNCLEYVCSIIELSDGNVLCGGDGILIHFDVNTYNIQKFNCHDDDITALIEINDNTLISSSNDETIKIWEY